MNPTSDQIYIYQAMLFAGMIPLVYEQYRDDYIRTGDESSFNKMLEKVRIN